MAGTDSSSISFTAYYTGEVWRQHGLSSDLFRTRPGNALFHLGQPVEKLARLAIGFSIQTTLLQRHHMIDHVVRTAIREQGVTQVVEIACGLSPRGVRFRQEFPELHYLEADLPGMLAHKHKLLDGHGILNDRHRLTGINILEEGTPDALDVVFERELDPTRKTLVITEGLVNYFDFPTISGFWRRLASALRCFPAGGYVTDLYPDFAWHPMNRLINFYVHSLSLSTRSRVTLHFSTQQAIIDGFKQLGFAHTDVHIPESYYGLLPIPTQRSASLVRVVESWV